MRYKIKVVLVSLHASIVLNLTVTNYDGQFIYMYLANLRWILKTTHVMQNRIRYRKTKRKV